MKSLVDRLRICSYTEIQAMKAVFEAGEGRNEYTFNASEVMKKATIGRSVIVAALKLFEVAGVIESRSLGMKGTYIKILDRKTLEEVLL